MSKPMVVTLPLVLLLLDLWPLRRLRLAAESEDATESAIGAAKSPPYRTLRIRHRAASARSEEAAVGTGGSIGTADMTVEMGASRIGGTPEARAMAIGALDMGPGAAGTAAVPAPAKPACIRTLPLSRLLAEKLPIFAIGAAAAIVAIVVQHRNGS